MNGGTVQTSDANQLRKKKADAAFGSKTSPFTCRLCPLALLLTQCEEPRRFALDTRAPISPFTCPESPDDEFPMYTRFSVAPFSGKLTEVCSVGEQSYNVGDTGE